MSDLSYYLNAELLKEKEWFVMGEQGNAKYTYIENDILGKIHQNMYKPGSKLPSESQMAKEYQTSVPTVRRALQELVYNGVVYKKKGSGTYVCDMTASHSESGLEKVNFTSNIYFLAFGGSSDSSVMQMIRGAQSYLFKHNCNLSVLCKTDIHAEVDLVDVCYDNHADGIIAFPESKEINHNSFELIQKYNIPTVMIERGPDFLHSLVSTYNLDGGYQMTKYLLGLGHKKIAFVMEVQQLQAEQDRLRGYRLALREAGIPAEEELIFEWKEKDRLLENAQNGNYTAIQAVSDKIAAKTIELLQRNGLIVPQDISVGGYDNWNEVKYVVPHITTIAQPFEKMGYVAAEKLFHMLEDKEGYSQSYLPVKLVIKDSCCPPQLK